jgi:cytochrome c peroxidase
MLFHDASLCFQGWQSCASCHPDGRADGLNWDLLNDGIGNPKNTKSLLFSHQTPPSMITAARGSAAFAVRSGFHHILFVEHDEDEARAVDVYLMAMRPKENPARSRDDAQIAKGMEIFFSPKTNCAACHNGYYYTDLKAYDVGTGEGRQEGMKFDTPTLREVWRTAPYLHMGQAASIRDVLTTDNANDQHGVTSHLSEDEIQALEAFLLSL